MLILTRRIGESIILGNPETQVVLLAISGNQARIGIKAPKAVEVHREEVYARIHPEYVPEEWTAHMPAQREGNR